MLALLRDASMAHTEFSDATPPFLVPGSMSTTQLQELIAKSCDHNLLRDSDDWLFPHCELPRAVERSLIDAAQRYSGYVMLVKPAGWAHADSCDQFLERMTSQLLCEFESECWPGSCLPETTVRVMVYRMTHETTDILREVDGFFTFKYPLMPEDISFWDERGECIFGCVCHEKLVFVKGGRSSSTLGRVFKSLMQRQNIALHPNPPWLV